MVDRLQIDDSIENLTDGDSRKHNLVCNGYGETHRGVLEQSETEEKHSKIRSEISKKHNEISKIRGETPWCGVLRKVVSN